ncbi:hypothetical protein ABET51_13415 [Metabacillus fastidiosus]|uniref:hypothetical protein n=1 Tax=Metabacillus fastidiosus TaxID=1458 RepID=UPI002E1B24B1|nr:hypothetical protein [Metabacillus fastidiosus]
MTFENIIENNLTESKVSKSFEGGAGSLIELQINNKAMTGNTGGSVQVIVQESEDNEKFCDSIMTKVYSTGELDNNDTVVFKKQKPYHRLHFVVAGGNPSIDIEVKQNEVN